MAYHIAKSTDITIDKLRYLLISLLIIKLLSIIIITQNSKNIKNKIK